MNKFPEIPLNFEQEIRLALEVPDAEPEFFSQVRGRILYQKIQSTPNVHPRGYRRQPTWFVMTAAIALAAITFLAIGPQNVLAAVQRLLGYIPEIGFVNHEQVIQLTEPVLVTRDGITVQVESAASDGENTRINLHIEGLEQIAGQIDSGAVPGEHQLKFYLADGETLSLKRYEVSYFPSYTIQLDFDPLPDDVRDAILSFNVIPGTPQGAAPEGWEIPLSFTSDLTLHPVEGASSLKIESDPVNGVILRLLSVSKTSDSIALQVQLDPLDSHSQISTISSDQLSIIDTQGKSFPWIGEPIFGPDNIDTMVLSTSSIISGEELILSLAGPVELTKNFDNPEDSSTFCMDFGINPVIGQSWDLDEQISIAGHTIHLTKAQLTTGVMGFPTSIVFQMEPDDQISGVRVSVDNLSGGATSNGLMKVYFTTLPTGQITFRVDGFDYQVDGSWEIHWQMP